MLRSLAVNHPVSQARLFQRLRWQTLRNLITIAHGDSLLRLGVIGFCCLLIWVGIFALAAEGFYFIKTNQLAPLLGEILGFVLDFLFLALGVLLVFSSSIILYSSLFSATETTFLLSTPATADKVFAYKFQGAVTFSSWAFVLLGSPILVSYGLVLNVAWPYYALLPFFFVGFVLFPGTIGALLCLLMVNFLPRRPKQVLAGTIVLLVLGLGLWLNSIRPNNVTDAFNRDFVQRLVGQIAAFRGPFSPNHWLSQGVQGVARGDTGRAIYYLALLWSNGLFLYLLVAWSSKYLFRRGYNRMATGGSLRKRYGGQWLDNALSGMVGFLNPQTRLLIVKDFRMFRRDPAQWAQVVIFSGLMVLYFANIRRFYQEHGELGRQYQNAVSLMNLAATALLLCAYTGRFIFPMLSLEGRKFWVLGLLPLKRDRLVWGKFAFSATWAVLAAEALILFSDLMLGMSGQIVGMHALTVAVLALGLSGLSVGLGASMPNFRETDPSKIAVGFGGTMNLIISLLFLILVIAAMAAPWHLYALSEQVEVRGVPLEAILVWWVSLGVPAGILLGAVAVALPLRIGTRALRRMEF